MIIVKIRKYTKLFKYLSFLKFVNKKIVKKIRRRKFRRMPYILNAGKKILRGKLFTYRNRYLKKHGNLFPNSLFFYIYFKKLRKLRRYFRKNLVNKYHTYVIKHIHINYFKHNNIENYISRWDCCHFTEHTYWKRFLRPGKSLHKSLHWIPAYIVRNYKYRLWRNLGKFQRSLKGFRYVFDLNLNNVLMYWYKHRYYSKYFRKEFKFSQIEPVSQYAFFNMLLRKNYFFITSKFFCFFKNHMLNMFILSNWSFSYLFKKIWLLKIFKNVKRENFFLFLLYRFPNFSLNNFKTYVWKRIWTRYNLPMFAQMQLIYNFIQYRGVFIIIGKYFESAISMTFSGYKTPFIVTKNRKSFWRDISRCFALYNYSYFSTNNNVGHILLPKLVKLNLFRNVFVEIGWSVATRIVLSKKFMHDKFSNYYLNSKSLIVSNFYFNGENILGNINSYFTHLLNNYTSYNFTYFFQKQKLKKKPISMHRQELRSMWWNRDNIKSFFIEKFKRTWFITRFCRYYEKVSTAGIQNLIWIEMQLSVILIRCKIVYLLEDSYDLIKGGFVYVNGIICFDPKYIVKLHDRIQFGLTKSFHLYHRELLSNALVKYKRLPSYVYSRFSGKNKFEMVHRDISARWPLKALWVKNDIPRHFEVDYLTMTIFVLYYPLYIKDIFPYYYLHIKFLSARCYNWRFFH